MSNTPPTRDDGRAEDAAAAPESEPETPVVDDAATEHAEDQGVAPELVEPADSTVTDSRSAGEVRETAGYEERIAEPVGPDTAVAPVASEPVAPAPQPVQTVYVTAPVPPRNKSNRGIGILFAFVALIVFAVLFVAVMVMVLNAFFPGDLIDRLTSFLGSTAFLIPVLVFVVAFILLVLIANRASWWAYVLGSFLVALVVYFGSIGVVLLTSNVFGMTAEAASASFLQLAVSPSIIVAAIVAREVTIWFGAAIAARGRRVKARNLEARAAYDREVAESRAENARADSI